MNLARGYRANSNLKIRQIKGSHTIGLNPDPVLIIKLPKSRFLRIISRSLFLAIVILALPSIGSFVRDVSLTRTLSEEHSTSFHDFLPIVFKDLVNEGLLKNGHKGLLLSPGIRDLFDNLWFLNEKGIDLVIDSDLDSDRQVNPNEVFDFVFASSLENTKFINRVLELDGIVVLPLGNYYDRSYEFLKQSNYKIVYLRQFDLITALAMRKIEDEGEEGVFGG